MLHTFVEYGHTMFPGWHVTWIIRSIQWHTDTSETRGSFKGSWCCDNGRYVVLKVKWIAFEILLLLNFERYCIWTNISSHWVLTQPSLQLNIQSIWLCTFIINIDSSCGQAFNWALLFPTFMICSYFSLLFVSPAKHGRHIGIMTPASASSLSTSCHTWFQINNSCRDA